jgi:hypothetical protein
LKLSVNSFDFIPMGQGQPIHRDVVMELEQYPEDKTEKDLERHVAPAIRRHMQDFLRARKNRGRPVADIEQGHISTASCILANISMGARADAGVGRGEGARGDDPEANKMLRRPYRRPWVHPDPDKV